MIFEGVITTLEADGAPHVTPLGFVRDGTKVTLAPYVPSRTLDNLRRTPSAVMNLTDDVRVIAGCLTGRRQWPTVRAGAGWRLESCLAHLELEVEAVHEDPERPRFDCRVLAEHAHAPFRGFNRAQAAVVEAAILVSRLDWLDPDRLARDMAYLKLAVEKTAGDREREAWSWLCAAVAAHPRHGARETAS